MTEAERERAAVVAWLRAGGFAAHWRRASFATRLKAAWLGFRAPFSLPQAACKMASTFIENGEHMKEGE